MSRTRPGTSLLICTHEHTLSVSLPVCMLLQISSFFSQRSIITTRGKTRWRVKQARWDFLEHADDVGGVAIVGMATCAAREKNKKLTDLTLEPLSYSVPYQYVH